MRVNSVSLWDFRNVARAEVSFSPGVNVLRGDNAQGKSNILESIYYFSRGRSFRGVADKWMIRQGAESATMRLSCRSENDRYDTILEAILPQTGRKRLSRGGAPLSGVKELVGSFRAVLFCPEHLSLVSGAPAERRSFLDIAIAQLFPVYVSALSVYTKSMAERNALLRQAADGLPVAEAQWDAYARQMAESGAVVSSLRGAYVHRLNAHVARCFADMTQEREMPELTYDSIGAPYAPAPQTDGEIRDAAQMRADAAQALYRALTEERFREIRAGTTLHGPHRDDIQITLNGGTAKVYASQGQIRSLALAMKLAEGSLSRAVGGEEPVYLLDDVFSELDAHRRRYLLSELGARQVIITSCDPDTAVLQLSDVAVFEVRSGTVTPVSGA